MNAALWAGGTSFSSTLAFAGGVHATYTWAMLPYLKHYQEEFAFYASDGRVQIRFPSPFLRNEPTPIEIEQMEENEEPVFEWPELPAPPRKDPTTMF